MSDQAFRLADGGLVDRGRRLEFRFDGRPLTGYGGDTLASALLANGVHLTARSFKYHRPRGILTAGSEEPNALVELHTGARRDPNTRATTVELHEGLHAASQNRFPSLAFDVQAIGGLLSPLLGAGFYYKTFMWPAAFWEKVYEPSIRHAAGLGRLSGEPDPDTYEKAFAHCDLLVIGAGPAGLMAALAAGRAGARVILADEDFRAGGRLLAESIEVGGQPGAAWADAAAAELASMDNVRTMLRTTVFGAFDGGVYGALERVTEHLASVPAHLPRQRMWKLFARHAILAAGALERPIVFANNDRPGIMLAGAMRSYANRHAVAPGNRVAVFTCNDDGWRTAADVARQGIDVAVVVDARSDAAPPAAVAADLAGVEVVAGGRVIGTSGRLRLRAIDVLDAGPRPRRITVDALAVSGGWNPNVALTCHQGTRPTWREDLAAFVPGTPLPRGMRVAGAAAGELSTAGALRSGFDHASTTLEALGRERPTSDVPAAEDDATPATAFWHVREGRGPAFVDLQNDVTAKDVELAHREGFRSVEHLKRYTTLGMATDQGKTANVPGLALMASLTGRSIEQTGTTTFRPPYTPVPIAAFAGRARGRSFRPVRLTPSHDWAVERGATFVEAGAWLRAQWFPRAGETRWRATVDREVTAVRTRVGVCDVSTLGKIDVQGTDAAAFLDRVYANTFSTVLVGRARYGLMLREDGFVYDDGTAARLGENHYLVTTTTANAAGVFRHLEYCRQVLWPELDVQLVSVTDHWAQLAVAGPRSRELLRKVVDAEHDISNAAFPYMAAGDVTVCGGVQARLYRISFSGELAYEVAVSARYGDALVRELIEAGREFDVEPYGTEALGVLRVEKGHAAGSELNGTTTAGDLGLGRMVSSKKDFIGRTLSRRPALLAPDRPVLVGFKPLHPDASLTAGAHFIGRGAPASAAHDQGYMTSVAYSPTLGTFIGLGFIRRGAERLGDRVRAVDLVRGRDVEVEITSPHFVDPEGERLRG